MVESSSNLVELPDCFDGSYGDGVEALGARDKIQSGLYNAVAIRPLIAPVANQQVAWNASMWSTYFRYQKVPYEFETTGECPPLTAPCMPPAFHSLNPFLCHRDAPGLLQLE